MGASLITLTAAAEASCAASPDVSKAVASASTLFVGTVTAVDARAVVATVEVTDVWRGDVSSPATVSGSPATTGATSVDRSYAVGSTYLFVPFSKQGEVWQDNICTATRPYDAAAAKLRPAGAHLISPSPSPSPSHAATIGASRRSGLTGWEWLLIAVALLGGGSLWAALSGRQSRSAMGGRAT